MERHALERYGMTELVTDAETLSKMEPNYELLKAVLSFRHLMAPKVLEVAPQARPAGGRGPQEAAAGEGCPPGVLGPDQPAAAQSAEGRPQPRLASHDPGQSQALRPRPQATDPPVAACSSRGSSIIFPGTSSWPSIAAAR